MIPLPVIDPDQAPRNLRLLDVRDSAEFDAAHAPGAIRVPVADWVAAARTPGGALDNTGYWTGQIAALGLGSAAVAGVYDNGRMTEAARVWFILQYFGLPAVILNGGWPAVAAARLTGITAAADAPVLRPGAGPVGLFDRHRLKQSLTEQTILDTRTRAEFDGLDLKSNRRGGHLPDAVLLPHADLLDGCRLRAPAELRARMAAAGFVPDRPLTTHCDGGGRAALAAVAALQAGYRSVSVYYLSFSDWAADESCPVISPR